jgi:hypothetical protein
VLNRLYIVIGLLAILAISAAFIIPRFVQWGDYRERMQAIGNEVLGAPVEIVGDIEFSLLPQPRLLMSQVVVGEPEQPSVTVDRIEAQFSLLDFLRDQYRISLLVLDRPVVELRVDAAGQLSTGLVLAEQVNSSNVSVASARIVDGAVRLADARIDQTFVARNVDGELRLDAPRGPFAFQGSGTYGGNSYAVRLTTDAVDAKGATRIVALARHDGGFTLSTEGTLATGPDPRFTGTMSYRKPPVQTDENGDIGRGDLVLSGAIEATPSRVLLSDYTVLLDENRAAARLQGAAEIALGANAAFNAVISGPSMALPPRDVTAEREPAPYELVRLLAELPLPPATGMPGRVGVDISEVDLRAVSLRDLRIDGTTDGTGWQLETLAAQLPGGGRIRLSGELSAAAGRPNFVGEMTVAAPRLHALAELWRKPAEGNPLLNTSGRLEARVSLVGGTLSLRNAVLTIGEQRHRLAAELGFASGNRHLNVSAQLGAMDAADSAALLALLPELSADRRFAVSFPKGRLDVAAEAATIAGLQGSDLLAKGNWEGGVLVFDQLAAADYGGAAFDVKLTAFGTLARPEISGTGRVAIDEGQAPALARLLDSVAAPTHVRQLLERSAPAELAFRLDAPSGDGGQGVRFAGRVGAADIVLHGQLGAGLLRALDGPMAIKLDLQAEDAEALTAQLGLGARSFVSEGSGMHVAAVVEGTPANSFATTLRLGGGGDSVGFSGNVIVSEPGQWRGSGAARLNLADASVLTELLGAGGISLPPVNGSADVAFAEGAYLRAEAIEAQVGGQPVTGSLELAQAGDGSAVSGSLELGRLDAAGLLAVLAGPAALLQTTDNVWPDGPLDLGAATRPTSGRVAITSPEIAVGNAAVTDASFDFGWDATAVRLRDFAGSLGGGEVALDLTLCCSGPLQDKQVSGRMGLSGVALDQLAPAAVARALEGTIDATGRFSGTGDSVLGIIAAMTGEGSYSVADLTIAGLDPAAFSAIGSLQSIMELDPEELSQMVIDRLDDGPFVSNEVSGGFTIAGGMFRSPNLAIEGQEARLFGSTTLRLTDLELGGGYVMSPRGEALAGELVDATTGQIVANLGGTLHDPRREFDVTGLVDGLMVRAFEVEVARLERLRAEDEARQRAAAEERARLAAELAAQRADEDEERRAEEEAAARAAAEAEAEQRAAEEARRREEEEARRRREEVNQPLDLGLPPDPMGN